MIPVGREIGGHVLALDEALEELDAWAGEQAIG